MKPISAKINELELLITYRPNLRIYPIGERINTLTKHYNLKFKSKKLEKQFIKNKMNELIILNMPNKIGYYCEKQNSIISWDKPKTRS